MERNQAHKVSNNGGERKASEQDKPPALGGRRGLFIASPQKLAVGKPQGREFQVKVPELPAGGRIFRGLHRNFRCPEISGANLRCKVPDPHPRENAKMT